MNTCDLKSISCINEVGFNVYSKMMIHHDVSTIHMDNVYGQHIQFHPLTICMQFATNPHLCN
jgi:hypothetical protein